MYQKNRKIQGQKKQNRALERLLDIPNSKTHARCFQEATGTRPEGVLEAAWALSEASRGEWGAVLGTSWSLLGAAGCRSGTSWSYLKSSWRAFLDVLSQIFQQS